jgi:hypothetical protein
MSGNIDLSKLAKWENWDKRRNWEYIKSRPDFIHYNFDSLEIRPAVDISEWFTFNYFTLMGLMFKDKSYPKNWVLIPDSVSTFYLKYRNNPKTLKYTVDTLSTILRQIYFKIIKKENVMSMKGKLMRCDYNDELITCEDKNLLAIDNDCHSDDDQIEYSPLSPFSFCGENTERGTTRINATFHRAQKMNIIRNRAEKRLRPAGKRLHVSFKVKRRLDPKTRAIHVLRLARIRQHQKLYSKYPLSLPDQTWLRQNKYLK